MDLGLYKAELKNSVIIWLQIILFESSLNDLRAFHPKHIFFIIILIKGINKNLIILIIIII